MPALDFLLTNPELILEARKDSEEWTLRFDATIKRPEYSLSRFEILAGSEAIDGYSSKGNVVITQQMTDNESRQSPDTEGPGKPGHVLLYYFPPGSELRDSEGIATAFTIYIKLHSDTFFRLHQANLKTHLVHLRVDTGITNWKEEGFVYGNDPDGNEIEWRAEKKQYAQAEVIELTITPRPENASERPAKQSRTQST